MNLENVFYKDDNGEVKYNSNCMECPYNCKQSFRSTIMVCKRTKELKKKGKNK